MRSLKILIFAFIAILTSCTTNNGDIGEWFGTWKVTEIKVGDEPMEGYDGSLFMVFQSNVVEMLQVGEHQSYNRCFGDWAEEGRLLILNFSYSTTNTQDPDYTLPPVTMMQQAIVNCTLLKNDDRDKIFTFTGTDDKTITYTIHKQ